MNLDLTMKFKQTLGPHLNVFNYSKKLNTCVQFYLKNFLYIEIFQLSFF